MGYTEAKVIFAIRSLCVLELLIPPVLTLAAQVNRYTLKNENCPLPCHWRVLPELRKKQGNDGMPGRIIGIADCIAEKVTGSQNTTTRSRKLQAVLRKNNRNTGSAAAITGNASCIMEKTTVLLQKQSQIGIR
jgi:hypothetical protein